jgi:hypothetical protein
MIIEAPEEVRQEAANTAGQAAVDVEPGGMIRALEVIGKLLLAAAGTFAGLLVGFIVGIATGLIDIQC